MAGEIRKVDVVGLCALCAAGIDGSTSYHLMGLCGECARRAGAAYLYAHGGERHFFLDPDGYAKEQERLAEERKKIPRRRSWITHYVSRFLSGMSTLALTAVLANNCASTTFGLRQRVERTILKISKPFVIRVTQKKDGTLKPARCSDEHH